MWEERKLTGAVDLEDGCWSDESVLCLSEVGGGKLLTEFVRVTVVPDDDDTDDGLGSNSKLNNNNKKKIPKKNNKNANEGEKQANNWCSKRKFISLDSMYIIHCQTGQGH